jgi:hypothetical protein
LILKLVAKERDNPRDKRFGLFAREVLAGARAFGRRTEQKVDQLVALSGRAVIVARNP